MTTVRINRMLNAPAERVWAAFTKPEAIVAWLWPDSFATTATVDLQVGGRYRIESGPTAMAVEGEYREIDEPFRLVYTWRWDGEEFDSLVTIELTPYGEKTELLLRHEQLPDVESRDSHAQGWNDCLDRLPGWLARPAFQ